MKKIILVCTVFALILSVSPVLAEIDISVRQKMDYDFATANGLCPDGYHAAREAYRKELNSINNRYDSEFKKIERARYRAHEAAKKNKNKVQRETLMVIVQKKFRDAVNKLDAARERMIDDAITALQGAIDAARPPCPNTTEQQSGSTQLQSDGRYAQVDCAQADAQAQLAAQKEAIKQRYAKAIEDAGENYDAKKAAFDQYTSDIMQWTRNVDRCTERNRDATTPTTGSETTTTEPPNQATPTESTNTIGSSTTGSATCVAQDTNAKKEYDTKIVAAITALNDTLSKALRDLASTQTTALTDHTATLEAALQQESSGERRAAVASALSTLTNTLSRTRRTIQVIKLDAINALLKVRNEASK
ncbi:hypothetical protein HY624_02915 [Candidatus Uhrbacteria bacterium]|nr:hypothetical protein [Candidatus Uhrbacteria bacterium]